MSQQFQAGRGQGAGRSGGRGQPNNSKKSTNKKIYKFSTLLNQGKKNFASYASMKEKIMQDFQKEFGSDVTRSLKKMETIDLKKEEPERVLSTESDAAKKATKQKGYDMKYQEEYSHKHFYQLHDEGSTDPCGGTPQF